MAHKIYSYSELDLDNMVYEYMYKGSFGTPEEEAASLVSVLDRATASRKKALEKEKDNQSTIPLQVKFFRKGLAIDLMRALTPAFASGCGIEYVHALKKIFSEASGIAESEL